jgi:hypothetical protein
VNVGTVDGVIKQQRVSRGAGENGGIYICSIDNLDKQEAITVTGSGGRPKHRRQLRQERRHGRVAVLNRFRYNAASSVVIRDSIVSQVWRTKTHKDTDNFLSRYGELVKHLSNEVA